MTEFKLKTDLIAEGQTDGHTLEKASHSIMEHLVALCGPEHDVDDPALSLDLSRNRMTVELLVRADDLDAAVDVADATLRAAVHGAGYGTPGWLTKRFQKAELLDA